MGVWILFGVQVVLSVATLVAILLTLAWARAGARDGREARKLVEALSNAFRRGHGDGYPSGTAVALPSPVPASSEPSEPSPVPEPAARSAHAPVSVEPAPASSRPALVPAESTVRPRTELPPASAEGRARDTERAASPAEVAEDERRTVEVPRVEVAPEAPEEARVRQLLLACPFHDGVTLAQHLRERVAAFLDEEHYPNVKHCEGASCFPGAWDVCGCPCSACNAHRHALTLAVRIFGLPVVRLPGEKPEAWELRRRAHEETPHTVVLPPSVPVVACMVAVSLPRADALFWAKLDRAIQDGVDVKHCRGPECDPLRPTCSCPCAPCDRRRTLAEQAEYEIRAEAPVVPPTEPAPHERVIERWHALQDASEADGRPASHCDGGTCGGEAVTLCECDCEGCARAVVLLLRAEREVLGGES